MPAMVPASGTPESQVMFVKTADFTVPPGAALVLATPLALVFIGRTRSGQER